MPKMHIDAAGKLQCPSEPSRITYNHPWPTTNGTQGRFVEPANGFVLHTEVGYEHSVEEEFNNPADQASAFFSIGVDGHIHQYGPVGHGWAAWTQAGGNAKWRGVENEDLGHPANPLTAAQIESNASIFEALSAHDKFPLQSTDDPNNGRGLILHQDGGAAWGGHACPGPVRAGQRPNIVNRARAIRGTAPTPPPPIAPLHLMQAALHVPLTGSWDAHTEAAFEAVRHNDHAKSDAECRLEQHAVGTAVDGAWGYLSQRAYRITVNRIQGIVGAHQDAIWGPLTDKDAMAFRARYAK